MHNYYYNEHNYNKVKNKINKATGRKHIDLVVVGPLLEASPKKVIGKIITSYMHT